MSNCTTIFALRCTMVHLNSTLVIHVYADSSAYVYSKPIFTFIHPLFIIPNLFPLEESLISPTSCTFLPPPPALFSPENAS